MNLSGIEGQDKAKSELDRYFKSNKIPHAFLFSGIPGIGKYSTAHAFSAFLNCATNDPGCNACNSCMKMEKGIHPDLTTISVLPDKSEISIDQIRELILKMRYAPLEGKYKITIIDQAEKLNIHSTNALLKTLEEPPQNSIIFLVTSNIRNIQPTIISRCSLIRFKPLPENLIEDRLLKMCDDEKRIKLAVKMCEGSLGKAISNTSGRYSEIKEAIADWLSATGKSKMDPIEISENLTDNYSDSMAEVFDVMLLIQRDLITLKKDLPRERLFNPDLQNLLSNIAENMQLRSLLGDSKLIYLTRDAIFHNNANSKIAMDNLFMTLSYGNN